MKNEKFTNVKNLTETHEWYTSYYMCTFLYLKLQMT